MEILKEKYHKHQEEVILKLERLKLALNEHSKRFNDNDTDWGYLGDLGRINDILAELDGFVESNTKI
jgi:hypothetical protein